MLLILLKEATVILAKLIAEIDDVVDGAEGIIAKKMKEISKEATEDTKKGKSVPRGLAQDLKTRKGVIHKG